MHVFASILVLNGFCPCSCHATSAGSRCSCPMLANGSKEHMQQFFHPFCFGFYLPLTRVPSAFWCVDCAGRVKAAPRLKKIENIL